MRRFNIKMDGQIVVLEVAERGSYAAAGKALAITTSAVRKQVEGVRTELGAPIFHRIDKRLVPTEAGGIYIAEIRESVRHARMGLDRVQAFVRAQRSDLRIGYSSHLSEQLLEVIVRLQRESSGPREFESLLNHQIVLQVLQGRMHLGLGFLPLHHPELNVRPLFHEPLLACLPQGHRLAAKQSIETMDLENEPMIAVARKQLPGMHKEIVEYFESEGVFLKFVGDAYLPREALWHVSRGTGVTLMTRSSASPVRPGVVLRPLSSQSLNVESGVFVRRDQHTGHVKELVDRIWAATAVLRSKSEQQKPRQNRAV